MLGVQEGLVAFANASKEIPVVVDVGGNGIALMPVTSIEVKDGRLVIACTATVAAKIERPATGSVPVNETLPGESAVPPVAPTTAPVPPAEPAATEVAESMEFEAEASAPAPTAPAAPAARPKVQRTTTKK